MLKKTRMALTVCLAAIVVLALAACATLGSEGKGDVGLPTAGVGPFRRLVSSEVPGIAPFVLDGEGGYREPAVLAEDPASAEPRVLLFAEASLGGRDGTPRRPVLVRSRAVDGRSFAGTGFPPGRGIEVVLEASEPWEGGVVTAPALLRVKSEVWLFYGGQGGIGLAISQDGGHSFTKRPGPVLGSLGSAPWEGGPPGAPSAYLEGDSVHLFYAAGGFLGEAVSPPGAPPRFTRTDPVPATPGLDPVLSPSPPVEPSSLAPGEKPPFDESGLGDPCVVPRLTPAGRVHIRVLYTGLGAGGKTAIGFAARYGHSGPLARQATPVYAAKGKERSPALLDLGERAFLYFTEPRASDAREAIGGAFSPGNGSPGPLVEP